MNKEEVVREAGDQIRERRVWLSLSLLLLSFGIGELVSSIFVILSTGGGHIAGIYVGGCSILLGFRGIFLRPPDIRRIDLLCQFLNVLIAIVGTSMQAALYDFIVTFVACSSYSSSKSTSCSSVPSSYNCYGNSDYYADAVVCEATYIQDSGVSSDQCTCISSEDQRIPLVVIPTVMFLIAMTFLSNFHNH